MPDSLRFSADDLRDYVLRFFTHLGVPELDARIIADVLISADLRGVSSHGLIRLHTYYGDRLRKGYINPLSPLKLVSEAPAALVLDGKNGMGQVVAYHAMTRCIEKAKNAGVAMATVRNSNHFGIAGYYAMMALPQDMIGISLTNARPLVTPTFGSQALLGTNPIAVAIPAWHERPYVLDMATSIVPIGKITVYQKTGQPIPAGWGVDATGNVTTDPNAVLNGGALLPLGGTEEMRGYKGYGLALMVDALCGVLAGAAFSDAVGEPSQNNAANVGHFFAALNIEAFQSLDKFKQDMDAYIQKLKQSPKAAGQPRIYIPGEKEYELADQYLRDGVPLLLPVVESLKKAGAEAGVPFNVMPITG